ARVRAWIEAAAPSGSGSPRGDLLRARVAALPARSDVAAKRDVAAGSRRGLLLGSALAAAGAALGVLFGTPMPGPAPEGRQMLALLAAAVVLWALDVVPDYVVGLGMMLAWIVLGIVPSEVALSGFTSSPFFLITGVLGMAAGLQASGLLFRMA